MTNDETRINDRTTSPEWRRTITRRALLARGGLSLAPAALGFLLNDSRGSEQSTRLVSPQMTPRAKSVIVLTMAGGPSQIDLFDPKQKLNELDGQPISPKLIEGEKFAQIRREFQLLRSPFQFAKHGESGADFSELLPHIASIADDLTIVRSMTTDSFNHDPAQVLFNTGSTIPGRPAMGAWLSYALGSECQDLPSFVVMLSGEGQPLGAHCWSAGFLPAAHQGVQFRSHGDPVLFLSDPAWANRATRRRSLDAIREVNQLEHARTLDPEIESRIAAYEMSYRMQTSVPSLMDLSSESLATHELYGTSEGDAAFAKNCLQARRMVERGVRFIQIYHRDWDHHGLRVTGGIDFALPQRCREVDRATAALITDLKQRGLLDSTLVVWGGEFGRTPLRESVATTKYPGRDHHRRAFTVLLAGGGLKSGMTFGATDELGYFVTENAVHIHDLHATLLHCLGLNHEQLTYRYLGRDFRLTDVRGRVVEEILA